MPTLFACRGGHLQLPQRGFALVDRADGGNLVVDPPRAVWERSELTPSELTAWSFLVSAAGRAMLNSLPQLAGGCINYWEAGNWALHEQAEPRGAKTAPQHRKVHLHLLGRSRHAASPSWRWGEAPQFPLYEQRLAWAAANARLTPAECAQIVTATERLLVEQYGESRKDVGAWKLCPECQYPLPVDAPSSATRCPEC